MGTVAARINFRTISVHKTAFRVLLECLDDFLQTIGSQLVIMI
jgi:hypothetical protein